MTLAPVFRSEEAVNALHEKGYMRELEASFSAHREAAGILNDLLRKVIEETYILSSPDPVDDLSFLQENFFLILFHSLFKRVSCDPGHLDAYTLLNFCIRGVVLSGDNLFDEEDKLVLPLRLGHGKRFMSIVQMMCFQGLIQRVLDTHAGWLNIEEKTRFNRDLLSALTEIGSLEGSEEAGVDRIPEVDEMIETVHRVRGGSLFSLAFIAPRIGERGANKASWEAAEAGIRRLGTAFQIVDDLTDLEFDLGRGSHNLLVAQVFHNGSGEEQALIQSLRRSAGMRAEGGWVEKGLRESAAAVLAHAKKEAEEGFRILGRLGFWFPPEDALLFVRAIAGDAGFERVQGIHAR
jgi:hypothetical protein